jgi:exodeoxyribonuclease V gamma subunit
VLVVHRADRADRLSGELAQVLTGPAADPLVTEIVAVPTRGMERWLGQRLAAKLGARPSRRDGVCANVVFPSPARLVADAFAAPTGIDRDADPWTAARLLWPVLETLDGSADEPWFAPLARHVHRRNDDAHRSRRASTARHLAALFCRYDLERPEMIRAWAAGDDVDAAGASLEEHAAWQPGLWRAVRARLGVPSLAERLPPATASLREAPELAGLPPRFALFALTRLPASQLEVLSALAAERDVHLFLLHPWPVSWERTAELTGGEVRLALRGDVARLPLPRHPLLASWGRDARELQVVLGRSGAVAAGAAGAAGPAEEASDPDTLLARIQVDIRADRRPEAPPAAPADGSVQVHACHGRGRQVEVLRDAILHALAEDPTLEPRDVIVLCPDIETFAPLIQATFGARPEPSPDAHPGASDLRVRLADRAPRQTNPVLGVVSRLLELVDERLTASQVMDLVDRPPVRRRFGLDDNDVAQLEEWTVASGVRWGLDAEHRRAAGLGGVAQGTWDAGLDRLLAGAALEDDDGVLYAGVLPLADVDSGRLELAGRFAELVDRLAEARRDLAGPRAASEWADAIAAAAEALTAPAPQESWQHAALHRLLAELTEEAGGVAAPLELADLRSLLADRLAGRPTRANFRTGHLTVCTLQPMRSVPHRVVCLLGLDDTVFPRSGARDGDDLLLDAPRPGDRDPRSEDRQIVLDALMAASDRLIVTFTGNDERTNAPRAPAVPVAELLDVAGEEMLVRHPLQPFDPRNFMAGHPWSFDEVALRGARAKAGPRRPTEPFLAVRLGPAPADVVDLDDLVAFIGSPVLAFLQQRLGAGSTRRAIELDDALPIDPDPLERFAIGERLLKAALAGVPRETAAAAERARGTLPPGRIGESVLASVVPLVELVETAAGDAGAVPGADTVDVRVALPGGRAIAGSVDGVGPGLLATVTFARVGARHRFGQWVRLLALTAARAGERFTAVTAGRARVGASRQSARTSVARVAPLDAERAVTMLGHLVELYDRGMREPLPVFGETSAVYAQGGRNRVGQATRVWETHFERGTLRHGEQEREEHRRVLGGEVSFEQLLAAAPRNDESGEGWNEAEPSRFGRYAHRWWRDLLACEAVTDR